jgi:hypothetical protein
MEARVDMHWGRTCTWLRRTAAAGAIIALGAAAVVAQPVPSSEEIQRQREEAERQRREYRAEKARIDAINERVRRYKELEKAIPFEPVPGTANLVQVYVNGHDLRDVAWRIYSIADAATPAGFASEYWPEVMFLNRFKDYDGGTPKYGPLDPQVPENNVAVFPNVRKQGYHAVVAEVANEDSSLALQLTAPAVLAYRKRLQEEVVRLASAGGEVRLPEAPARLPGENHLPLLVGVQTEPQDTYPPRRASGAGSAQLASNEPVPVDRPAPLDPAPPAWALRQGINMLGPGYEGYNLQYKPERIDLQPELGAIAFMGGRNAAGEPATQPGAYLAFNQRLFGFLLTNESAFVAFSASDAPVVNGGSLSAGLDVDILAFNLAGMIGITGLRVVGETEVGPSYSGRLRLPVGEHVWLTGLYRWSDLDHFRVEERDAQGGLLVGRSGVLNASYFGIGVTLR